MRNMMKRRKKRSKKKSCLSQPFENVYSYSASELNVVEMTAEMMCQLYEGQLYKYTNVMKGWQFRWFVLDPQAGVLNYYLNENERKQQPRGWVHLEAAVISPSDEDSNTFTVNSSSGESFKLRAQDARARQEWVNRLRAVSQYLAMAVAQNRITCEPQVNRMVTSKSIERSNQEYTKEESYLTANQEPKQLVAELHSDPLSTFLIPLPELPKNNPPLPPREHLGQGSSVTSSLPSSCSVALWDAFTAVREHLFRAEQSNFLLSRAIDDLPVCGELRHVDPDLLMLKAASQAMLMSLSQCLFILQQQSQDVISSNKPSSKSSSKQDQHSSFSSKKKYAL